ncbi:MAG: DUF4178 domain-containing protein [Proteobacteria bacterium]|nr:DUF4178 domain-containing protein [Pseudomonadota bacterium]
MKPDIAVDVGMTCRFDGVDYEVVALVMPSVREDGETYSWHEFYLKARDASWRILEFDEGDWHLSTPFAPKHAPKAAELATLGRGGTVEFDGKRLRVAKADEMRVLSVDGKPPLQIETGDVSRYLDLKSAGSDEPYCLEWDETGAVEAYRQRHLSRKEVYAAFPELVERGQRAARERIDYLRPRRKFAAACLFVSAMSFALWANVAARRGELVRLEKILANELKPGQPARFGPYELKPSDNFHALGVWADLRQARAWVSAVLVSGSERELLGEQEELYHEAGNDEDGAWSSAELKSQRLFRVESMRPFYVTLTAQAAAGAVVGFHLMRNVGWGSPLLLYGIATLILGLCVMPWSAK